MHADHHIHEARQHAELARAEAQALDPDQAAGMDDMGDYLEKLHTTQTERRQALAVGALQAGMGGLGHG